MLHGSTSLWPYSKVDEAVVAKVTVCRNCALVITDTGNR